MRHHSESRLGQDLGYTYESGAIVPDGTPSVERADPIADYVPNARPGARAPHLWLERGGERLSSLDLFDTALVVLTGPNGDPWREAAAEIGRQDRVPLDVYRVGSDAADLVDHAGGFLELYGIDAGGAVLVRPDGFVGWRAQSLQDRPAAALRGALDQILARARARAPA